MDEQDRRGVIICSHVAIEGHPILRALRDEPIAPEFSGWQFTCGLYDHDDASTGRVWLVDEIIELEPTLRPFIDCPPGTGLSRSSPNDAWIQAHE